MLSPDYEAWCVEATPYFRESLGLQSAFARPVARLYLSLWFAGLAPRLTSGFRDPSKQRELRALWDSGVRRGFLAKPANPDTSLHCKTSFTGAPASRAVDMPCTNDRLAAQIASQLGIGAGLNFREPDPGHYYSLEAV